MAFDHSAMIKICELLTINFKLQLTLQPPPPRFGKHGRHVKQSPLLDRGRKGAASRETLWHRRQVPDITHVQEGHHAHFRVNNEVAVHQPPTCGREASFRLCYSVYVKTTFKLWQQLCFFLLGGLISFVMAT